MATTTYSLSVLPTASMIASMPTDPTFGRKVAVINGQSYYPILANPITNCIISISPAETDGHS